MAMGRTRSPCWARAASGQRREGATAAPPSSVITSRRFMPLIPGLPERDVSLNHLVGGYEQLIGHAEAEHPGGPGVDDQLELVRLHDRQVRRLGTLEDAAGIDADLTPRILNAGSVAHQPTGFRIVTQRICRWEPVERRQLGQLDTPAAQEGIAGDQEGVGPLACKSCEGRIDSADGPDVEDLDLQPESP